MSKHLNGQNRSNGKYIFQGLISQKDVSAGDSNVGEMTDDERSPAFPNLLRKRRDELFLTQAQIALQCAVLANQQPLRYVQIGVPAISLLEAGKRRPRAATAATLAQVLNSTTAELFPEGLDDPRRNPEGKTRIAPNRPTRSKSRKASE